MPPECSDCDGHGYFVKCRSGCFSNVCPHDLRETTCERCEGSGVERCRCGEDAHAADEGGDWWCQGCLALMKAESEAAMQTTGHPVAMALEKVRQALADLAAAGDSTYLPEARTTLRISERWLERAEEDAALDWIPERRPLCHACRDEYAVTLPGLCGPCAKEAEQELEFLNARARVAMAGVAG